MGVCTKFSTEFCIFLFSFSLSLFQVPIPPYRCYRPSLFERQLHSEALNSSSVWSRICEAGTFPRDSRVIRGISTSPREFSGENPPSRKGLGMVVPTEDVPKCFADLVGDVELNGMIWN